jgi:hypothetical protein
MRIYRKLLTYLKRLLLSGSENNLDYYNSISELPLINWWKFNETKDVKYFLRVYADVSTTKLLSLEGIYSKLMDEYTKEFGINEHLLNVLEKQIAIAKLKADFMSGSGGNLTLIEVAELELAELVRGVNGMGFHEVKAILEKQMGFRIDPKITTVMEYYSYIKLIDGKKD